MFYNLKRRLAVFLAIVLVVPCVVTALPATTQEVEAAKTFVYSGAPYSTQKEPVIIEKDQTFNIGDFINVYPSNGAATCASLVPAVYTSNKPSVASVDGKGNVKTLADGTAKITISYAGTSCEVYLKVDSGEDFSKYTGVSETASAVKALEKLLPSAVTVGNGYDVLKSSLALGNLEEKYQETLGYNGAKYDSDAKCNRWILPSLGIKNRASALLNAYAYKNSPTATTSSKQFRVKSISINAKKGEISVKLKSAVTKDQVLALQIENRSLSKATMRVPVDMNKSGYFYGMGTVKVGDKTLKLKAKAMKFDKNWNVKYVNKKLKKGVTYQIGSKKKKYEGYWARGKKVKAK